MKTNHIRFYAIFLVTLIIGSCNKDKPSTPDTNPLVQDLPGVSFSISAVENRGDIEYQWTISKTGKTDSVSEELDDMYITDYNSLTFTLTPESDGEFPGFNIKSSNTGAVEVEIIDKYTFIVKRPKYNRSGDESTIEVWNGTGSQMKKIAFKVFSKHIIHPTAFRFIVDGQNVDVKLWDSWEHAEQNKTSILTIPMEEKVHDVGNVKVAHKVILKGPVPENCSYDILGVDGFGIGEKGRKWCLNHGLENDESIFFSPDDFYDYYGGGPLVNLNNKNVVYTSCARGFTGFASQFSHNILFLSKDNSYFRYAMLYITLPFSSESEYEYWYEYGKDE